MLLRRRLTDCFFENFWSTREATHPILFSFEPLKSFDSSEALWLLERNMILLQSLLVFIFITSGKVDVVFPWWLVNMLCCFSPTEVWETSFIENYWLTRKATHHIFVQLWTCFWCSVSWRLTEQSMMLFS